MGEFSAMLEVEDVNRKVIVRPGLTVLDLQRQPSPSRCRRSSIARQALGVDDSMPATP